MNNIASQTTLTTLKIKETAAKHMFAAYVDTINASKMELVFLPAKLILQWNSSRLEGL